MERQRTMMHNDAKRCTKMLPAVTVAIAKIADLQKRNAE